MSRLAAVISSCVVFFCGLSAAYSDDKEKPISVAEAIEKVDKKVFVELTVKTTKDRLERRGEIYLDSDVDFRDRKNLAIVVTREGAESLKKSGVADPAEHFRTKKIRVRGTVIIKDEVRRIEVTDAKQIELVKE